MLAVILELIVLVMVLKQSVRAMLDTLVLHRVHLHQHFLVHSVVLVLIHFLVLFLVRLALQGHTHPLPVQYRHQLVNLVLQIHTVI